MFYLITAHGGNLCYNVGHKAITFMWKCKATLFDYLDSYLDSHLFAGGLKYFYNNKGERKKNIPTTRLMWIREGSSWARHQVDVSKSGPRISGLDVRRRTNGAYPWHKHTQEISLKNFSLLEADKNMLKSQWPSVGY